jgi:hypothetical protein
VWPDLPIAVRYELSSTESTAVEVAVRDHLKDPSAVFGESVAGKGKSGGIAICGLVDPKRQFGGYTGPHPFIAAIGVNGFIAVGVSESPAAARATLQRCEMNGLGLSAS